MNNEMNSGLFKEAILNHKSGNLEKAFHLYSLILQSEPNHNQTLFMLGNLFYQVGKFNESLHYLQTAVNNSPEDENYLNSLGKTYLSLGMINNSKISFEKAISINPKFIKPYLNLGKLYKREKDLSKAEECYREALKLNPLSIAANNNLGNILHELNKTEEAQKCYENILKVNPNQAEAHLNLANIFLLNEETDKAFDGYKNALKCNPNMHDAIVNLAKLYLKENNIQEAIDYLQKAVSINSNNAETLKLLGQAYQSFGNHEAAVINLQKSLHIDPLMFETAYLLALSYNSRGDKDNAIKYLKMEIENFPESSSAHFILGKLYLESHDHEAALYHFEETKKLKPEFSAVDFEFIRLRLDTCNWKNRDEDIKNLVRLIRKVVDEEKPITNIPLLNLNYFMLPLDVHLAAAKHNASMHSKKVEEIKKSFNFKFNKRDHKKLRIGYLSPDLREHAVGMLIYDIFKYHDRSKFEIYAYSLATPAIKDFYTKNIEKGVDHFVNLSKLPFDVSAKKIYNDEIDILIDLAGYTHYAQTEIPALQPAPIQALYLGYPNTMGADFIKYILADPQLITDELEKYYHEKIVYLPQSFVYSPLEFSKKKMKRSDFNIPNNAFVFCCFNSLYKISPEVFTVWMNILTRVTGSVLWLNSASDSIKSQLIHEAASRGVGRERILFADRLPQDEYMKRFEIADLFLDTFFYSAGSTGVSALAGGLPILTLAGETNASRMCASMLHSADLDDLICYDIGKYEDLAVNLAMDHDKLTRYRQKLSNNRSELSLFNVKKFVAYLEDAYSKMWEDYMAGNPPRNILIKQ